MRRIWILSLFLLFENDTTWKPVHAQSTLTIADSDGALLILGRIR